MNIIYFLWYPFCKDCIYQRWFLCEQTKLSTYQSRKNQNLCGENANLFSPQFNKLTLNHTYHKKI